MREGLQWATAVDVLSVYASAVCFGVPLVSRWYGTLLFAVLLTALNVAPRTLTGIAVECETGANSLSASAEKSGAKDTDGEDEDDGYNVESIVDRIFDPNRFLVRLPNSLERCAPFRVAVFSAAAAGAIVSPLDAENWWQYWPTPSIALVVVVALAAMVLPRRWVWWWTSRSSASKDGRDIY